MKLTLEQIKKITFGAVDVVETDLGLAFKRFTDKQADYYAIYREEGYKLKCNSAAGIRLHFLTDSKKFALDYAVRVDECPTGGMARFDLYIDGVLCENFGIIEGDADKHFEYELGDGVKTVELYLPWTKMVYLSNITLDDGASFAPVKRSRTMLAYGDSITHGYFAYHPSLSYASKLARALDADQYNKAIGGDRFFPELLELEEPVKPDIITVAYGTNDWSRHTRATVQKRSRAFLTALRAKFPSAKIFVITPIWRDRENISNYNEPKFMKKFGGYVHEVKAIIEENCKDLANVTVIDGMKLVPHDQHFFDDGLHPNDLGMCIYADNLYLEIEKHL